MEKNMGVADCAIRAVIGLVLLILAVLGVVKGAASWVLGAIAVILLGTSAVGYCGLYKALGICTLKQPPSASEPTQS